MNCHPRKAGEHDHSAATGGAALGCARLEAILHLLGVRLRRSLAEQSATEGELLVAMAVGEEAVVADAMEAIRQGVQGGSGG